MEQPDKDLPPAQPGPAPSPETPSQPPGPPDRDLPPPGFKDPLALSPQELLIRFLDAELDHSVRRYSEANDKLDGFPNDPTMQDVAADPLLRVVALITPKSVKLNTDLLDRRYAVEPHFRRPQPPSGLLEPNAAIGVLGLYDVARRALDQEGGDDADSDVIRRSILIDVDKPDCEPHDAQRLRNRFTYRERIATNEIGSAHLGAPFGAAAFAHADLQGDRSAVAAEALLLLKQAHLDIHEVEHRRSQHVRGMLARTADDLEAERRLLRRSIVLSTLTMAISQVVPWAFAADEDERRLIQDEPREARDGISPANVMWIARQVTLLSLYRRAHGFRLLGDHERAYNDYRKLHHVGRRSRAVIHGDRETSSARATYVDILSALSEYRIGELYRSDHDYAQALAHLCNGHAALLSAGRVEKSAQALEKPSPLPEIDPEAQAAVVRFPRLEVHLRLCKGTAYFETGEMKRALKWHVRAWLSLEDLIFGCDESARHTNVDALNEYLESVKLEPDLDKTALKQHLEPAVDVMCDREVPQALMALAADVLGRIGHILMVLDIADDASVPRFLERAVELDPFNLFARTALLRWRLMDKLGDRSDPAKIDRICPEDLPDAVSCWPSGASDADQAIRVGIHLLLRRLLDDARSAHPDRASEARSIDMRVAQALVARFIDYTDSIYLRFEVINHYLMRPRMEAQRPELAEQPPADPYLEFVSLRRFGGFTPFLPRPGDVAAVGGGYLVRVCSPSSGSQGGPKIFNVLVDPGEGLVDNLYREGFGIADIDMVVATNDHPDHLSALDAIIALRNARRPPESTPSQKGTADGRLPLLGNASVVQRYRSHPQLLVRGLDNPLMHEGLQHGVTILDLPVVAEGSTTHHSVPFKLTFADRGVNRSITFMSDTVIATPDRALGGPLTTVNLNAPEWKEALESDIVVANVGDVSVAELRDLALLPGPADSAIQRSVDAFDASVHALAANGRTDEVARIRRALSQPPATDAPAGLLRPDHSGGTEGAQHPNLRGLLAVAKQMSDAPQGVSEPRSRVLVVGELREQLGAFRRTIADEINNHILGIQTSTIALTADVGLRVRLDDKHRNRVLCSVCSLNNDRLNAERFHTPRDMTEVCVKGDNEATYWMCPRHRASEQAFFIEHSGSYRPLAAGYRVPFSAADFIGGPWLVSQRAF